MHNSENNQQKISYSEADKISANSSHIKSEQSGQIGCKGLIQHVQRLCIHPNYIGDQREGEKVRGEKLATNKNYAQTISLFFLSLTLTSRSGTCSLSTILRSHQLGHAVKNIENKITWIQIKMEHAKCLQSLEHPCTYQMNEIPNWMKQRKIKKERKTKTNWIYENI